MTISRKGEKGKIKVLLRSSAVKDIDKLDDKLYQRVLKALQSLENNYRPRGSKKIHTRKDMYRLRVGDHRILYKVEKKEDTVIICRVVHRKEAYK
ncbi:type II toxin-antitoxin system RelE/ParE family toxin [bacterium]|nr:type II toxin-antitoxin system RelE/ParE family toxin [bacterium]